MTIEKTLKELGLSSGEAAIYLALLKTGGLPASLLAKEVGQRRTTSYATVKGLVQKGFVVAYVKRGRQFFVAEKPQQVVGAFEDKLKAFTASIPLLESLEKKFLQTSGVRFIETVVELKRFYTKVLRAYRGRSYSIIGNAHAWEHLDEEFFIQFRKDRAKAGIHTRLLLSADSRGHNPKETNLLRDVKFLPEKFVYKSTVDIFDDQVLIISPEHTAVAVVIAVPAMVDVFRSMFAFMWEASP